MFLEFVLPDGYLRTNQARQLCIEIGITSLPFEALYTWRERPWNIAQSWSKRGAEVGAKLRRDLIFKTTIVFRIQMILETPAEILS